MTFPSEDMVEATYKISKKTCGAGLLAIAAVCSQSLALQLGTSWDFFVAPRASIASILRQASERANFSWHWTERPVQDEGRSVKDIQRHHFMTSALEIDTCPVGCHGADVGGRLLALVRGEHGFWDLRVGPSR